MTPPELDVNDELAHAAADLEAVSARLDETVDTVERLEAVLDAVLDDADLQVCVVDEDLRIAALSRGLADRWPGAQPPLGRRLDEVAPESWGDLSELIGSATEDRWIDVPTEAGVLSARRVSTLAGGDNRGSSGGAQIVLRLVEE